MKQFITSHARSVVLSPVNTSNNVEATFDFVEAIFQYSTLLPKTATMSNEFIEKSRHFDKVQCCFDIVAGVDGALVGCFSCLIDTLATRLLSR